MTFHFLVDCLLTILPLDAAQTEITEVIVK